VARTSCWGISSLVERPLRMREAPGSIPGFSTEIFESALGATYFCPSPKPLSVFLSFAETAHEIWEE